MGILGKLQDKIEIYRLEQQYTRRKNKSGYANLKADYVDGEYVYTNGPPSPTTRGAGLRGKDPSKIWISQLTSETRNVKKR